MGDSTSQKQVLVDDVKSPINKVAYLPKDAKEILISLGKKWKNVLDPKAMEVITLKGAMTNEVFKVKWKTAIGETSQRVLVRMYGEGTGIFFNRDDEIKAFEFISKSGHGPRLLGRFANGRVEEFINARTLFASDLRDPSISALIAVKLREFHDLNMPGPKKAHLWDVLRNWLVEARRLASPEEVEMFHLDTMDKEISILEERLSNSHQKIGFCHNDLQYGNIMIHEDTKSLTLIDYEYASYNPIAYDIANHFCEMAANYHTETPHILDYSNYPGEEQSDDSKVEELLDNIEKFTLANHIFWGLWGIISEHVNNIDFDYKEYAKQRFQDYWLRKENLMSSNGSSHDLALEGEEALTPSTTPTKKSKRQGAKLKKFFSVGLFKSKRDSPR
ncbi:hypothetical protein PIB30_075038 [Stylosanthes scabra]|uniref:Choline kinase 2 n=1 Tax=Stylosanthes scabra TaxID=79078 RepID=A0ABU6ZNG4_9FABA|nr:hypothetical protein [Stylosanthes scabra]